MGNNKQTAVEWLCERLALKLGVPMAISFYIDHAEEIAEAKEMHKQEIMKAFDFGDYNIDLPDGTWEQKYKSAEQYYNETYGGNNE